MTQPRRPSARLLAGILLLAAAGSLAGCVGAALVGGAAATAVVVADRRQPEVVLGDERINITISSRMDEAFKDRGHVNVTSYNYAVLLTGEVPTAEMKAEAERIASQVPKVKGVVNELRIAAPSSLPSRSNDTYLTGKVKANFVSRGSFQPNHVKVVTENGVVYLLGLVTRQEADNATELARSTPGVQKVVRIFEYVVPVNR